MYKDILLAIDLEDASTWDRAAPQAVALAKAFGADLHVMAVVPDFGMTLVASFFPKDFEEKALDEANARLQHLHAQGRLVVAMMAQQVTLLDSDMHPPARARQ